MPEQIQIFKKNKQNRPIEKRKSIHLTWTFTYNQELSSMAKKNLLDIFKIILVGLLYFKEKKYYETLKKQFVY